MNIVFYLFLVAGLIFLWFLLASLFKPIGKFFYRIWDEARKEMNDEENNEEKKF